MFLLFVFSLPLNVFVAFVCVSVFVLLFYEVSFCFVGGGSFFLFVFGGVGFVVCFVVFCVC